MNEQRLIHYMDKEYLLLETLSKNENVSQRELSNTLGISLGGVNILLNKMIKEGLIKCTTIPAKRVMYMLTPKGIVEKANKTHKYITQHYNYILETKDKIKEYITYKLKMENKIYFVLKDDELYQIIKLAINEIGKPENIIFISGPNEIKNDYLTVVTSKVDEELYKDFRNEILLEKM